MTDNIKEQQDRRIAEMSAFLEALSGQQDTALDELAKSEDPDSVRYRLSILMDANRYEEAAKMVRGRDVDVRWCDIGIRVLARAGDMTGAAELLAEVRKLFGADNETVRLRSIWEYASVFFETAFSDRAEKYTPPGSLTESETAAMKALVATLSEVETRLLKDGIIKSRLEVSLASLARKAHFLLANTAEHRQLAELLLTYSPIPLDVMQDIGMGIIPCPEDVPARLRADHPDDNQALLSACVLEADKLDRAHDALVHALELVKKVTTRDEKRVVAEFLVQISSSMAEQERDRAMKAVKALLGENSVDYSLIEIEALVRSGQTSEALARLEETRAPEDPVWMQVYAHALLGEGREREAAEMFMAAGQKVMHPDILRKAGDLSLRANEWDQAEASYQKILELNPNDSAALHNLGSLYAQRGEYNKACTYFGRLAEAEPGEEAHRINLAMCQKEAGDFAESLSTYESISGDTADLPVVFGKADVLRCLGDTDAAFQSLIAHKDRYWDTPAFVALWLDLAYAAGEEDAAHDALKVMIALSKTGKVDEKAFRMVQTDEMLEMFKDAAKATEGRKRHLHTEMLKGRMPWIWAAQVSGDAVYMAWRMRTQDLGWYGDDPVNRASFSVYATNRFHAREDEGGRRVLLPLECAPAGAPVAADLSALISLHRLGILELAAQYFGDILVPQAYLQTVLEDGRKMVLHQRSSKQTAERISRLLSVGTVATIEPADDTDDLPTVDEHSDSDSHRYRLVDLLEPVYSAGLVDDAAYERIRKVCGKPSGVSEDHPGLVRLQEIRVELSTLETVTTFGLLDPITEFYRVHIVGTAQKELSDRLDVIRFQEDTRSWHFDLWETLRNDARFRFVQHTVPPEMAVDKGSDSKDLLAFLSSFVAEEKGIPLLADDRVCQALRLNEGKSMTCAACGTDDLVRALLADGLLEVPKAANAFLSMIRWRYRFLVPSAVLLKTFAAHYKGNPPGRPLQDVAEYVHDCMRDTGLFGGPENTDLKDSMAMRLFLSWLNVSAEFLVAIWNDEEFKEETAQRLTEWCVREFLPSLPRAMHGNIKVRTAGFANRLLLSHMLLNANNVADKERVSSAMKAVQAGLKLSGDEYQRIVTEILNDTQRTEPHS